MYVCVLRGLEDGGWGRVVNGVLLALSVHVFDLETRK